MRSDNLCQGVKVNGDPCNNYSLKGSDFCRFHQPEADTHSENRCKWVKENGFPCEDIAVEGSEFCRSHQPDQAGSQRSALADEASLVDRIGAYYQRFAAAFNSLFAARKILVDDFGSGDPDYLVYDFLDHIQRQDDIEFYLPTGGVVDASQIAGDSILPGVVNTGAETAEVELSYVDYATGEAHSTAVRLAPNQTYIDMGLDDIPAGQYGCTIRAEGSIQTRNIVKLVLPERSLSATRDAFIPYQLPVSEQTPLVVQHVIATLVLGSQNELLEVLELPCELEDGRIYFDKRAMLKAINTNEAVDGVLVVQLEGELILAASTHTSANTYLPDYSQDTAESRFETTAEVVEVRK